MIKKLLFLVVFLFFWIIAGAQSHFYYYKSERVPLTLNTERVNFRVSPNFDSKSLERLGFKLSNFHEDESVENTYFGEIDFNSKDYQTSINNLKKLNGVIDVFPHFQKTTETSIGTSDIFYIKLKETSDLPLLEQEVRLLGGTVLSQFSNMPLWVLIKKNPSSSLTSIQMANTLYESGNYADMDPAFMFDFRANCTNDTNFSQLWGLHNTLNSGIDINACAAWNITDGNGVKVAVIDTGIDLVHNDLQANISSLSYDCQTQTSPSILRPQYPNYYHGTHVAGTIGAIKDNNLQVVGVAPESELMSISHSLYIIPNISGQLASGFTWAYQNGADVINNSWGDPDAIGGNLGSTILENAIMNAMTLGRNGKGTVVIFATGNENGALRYPASQIAEILAVGSITSNGNRSSFSNYGSLLDVVAPGSDILSTMPNNGISSLSGTSMAAPHVAGVAALVLSVNPDLTRQEAVDIIERTSKEVRTDLYTYSTTTGRPNGDWNNEMGYGLVNAYEAVMDAGILDLYMRNSLSDNGDEPDTVSPYFHDSPDIWIRNNDDNGTTHQNAEFHPSNPNYVYVRVHNRGTIPSTVNDSLELYWAKGSTSLNWKDHWDGTFQIQGVTVGGELPKKQIPILQPGQSTIVKFEWYPPNPDDYEGITPEPWHFCLAARINSEKDPMNIPETNYFAQNVQNNNNIAWKNLTVVDVQPNKPIGGAVYVANPYNITKAFRFKLYTETLIFEEAEVNLALDPVVYDAWVQGGRVGTGIKDVGESTVQIVSQNAYIDNVILEPQEVRIMNLTFNFLTVEYTPKSQYIYHI